MDSATRAFLNLPSHGDGILNATNLQLQQSVLTSLAKHLPEDPKQQAPAAAQIPQGDSNEFEGKQR